MSSSFPALPPFPLYPLSRDESKYLLLVLPMTLSESLSCCNYLWKKVMNRPEVEIIPSHHPIFLGCLIHPQRWCYTGRSDHNLGSDVVTYFVRGVVLLEAMVPERDWATHWCTATPSFVISERMSPRWDVRHGPTDRRTTGVKRSTGERFYTSVNYCLRMDLIKWNAVSGWGNANTVCTLSWEH